ncbi:hypothetical protein D187_001989 [Cystobacter fuscus DSM 2262]|uniref:Uncharacterized protein n=1 Tax=Cystobacter fuscus (strain ATCC 25194 / DSM 2262 / NBRC 100088 / M29) TaxID=1242864 RepID=S9PDV2_CYSF2|nr:hypothetical protein [Cystobacter fuscus]EPX60502.1 hypothetical protein D187_001989 [Cystobacter fuscus DSM 2262]
MKSGFRPDPRLRQLGDSPLSLLLVTGAVLGSMLPMSRLARAAGWSPLAFAFWPALGSGLLLALAGPRAGARDNVGTRLTSWVYTSPPLFTPAFAWVERYRSLRLAGILLGTGVISGLLFFNEHLTVPTWVAMAILLAGSWLVNPRPQEART